MTLLGHNGAGKSTLINYLLGFYTKNNEHPFLENFSKELVPLTNIKIGYAPESALLNLQMSANDYYQLMASLKNIKDVDILKDLKRVKLDVDPNIPLKQYSKGMKQRFLLAMALMGTPEIVILDEPTSGLDPYGQKVVEDLLLSLKDSFKFIVCTHSLKLAYGLNEEVWILKEGEVVVKQNFNSLEDIEKSMLKHQPERLQ